MGKKIIDCVACDNRNPPSRWDKGTCSEKCFQALTQGQKDKLKKYFKKPENTRRRWQ